MVATSFYFSGQTFFQAQRENKKTKESGKNIHFLKIKEATRLVWQAANFLFFWSGDGEGKETNTRSPNYCPSWISGTPPITTFSSFVCNNYERIRLSNVEGKIVFVIN